MKYIPCEEIKKLTTPVLILQGSTDIQVAPSEAMQLKNVKKMSVLFCWIV